MKKVVIDANVLLSFVTDRNPAQQEKAAALFEAASRMAVRLICPQNVITEFVYVLDKVYHLAKKAIRPMVADLVSQPGLTRDHELDADLVLKWWPEQIDDFGDAIVAAACQMHKPSEVATFDAAMARQLQRIGVGVHTFR